MLYCSDGLQSCCWMYCFDEAIIELRESLTSDIRQITSMLRLLQSRGILKVPWELLETTLFWTLEKIYPTLWHRQHSVNATTILNTMLTFVKDHFIPHYFLRNCNLLNEFSDVLVDSMALSLRDVVDNFDELLISCKESVTSSIANCYPSMKGLPGDGDVTHKHHKFDGLLRNIYIKEFEFNISLLIFIVYKRFQQQPDLHAIQNQKQMIRVLNESDDIRGKDTLIRFLHCNMALSYQSLATKERIKQQKQFYLKQAEEFLENGKFDLFLYDLWFAFFYFRQNRFVAVLFTDDSLLMTHSPTKLYQQDLYNGP